MTGDVLLIKRHHRLAAQTLVKLIMGMNIDKPIIAIAGESGSGKSELSHSIGKVFKAMGKKVKVITTDDFYQSLPSERTVLRIEKGIAQSVGPQEYDWQAIHRVTDDYLNKSISNMPCVDLINDQVDRLTVDFKDIEILIFDGLYSIKNTKANFRVLIDIPYTLTKKAQLKRGKEPMDPNRLEILMAEHKAVTEIRGLADFFITERYKVVKAK